MVDATHYEGGRRRDDARSHGHPIRTIVLSGLGLLAAGAAVEGGRQVERSGGDLGVAARTFIADLTGIGRNRSNEVVSTGGTLPVAEAPAPVPQEVAVQVNSAELPQGVRRAGTHGGSPAYIATRTNLDNGFRMELHYTLRDPSVVVDPQGGAERARINTVQRYGLPENAVVYNFDYPNN